MLLRATLLFGMAAYAVCGFSQTKPAVKEVSVPDGVAFELFFQHVASMEASAAKLDAEGKTDGKAIRGHFRGWAQITEKEAQVLTGIANAYQAEFATLDSAAKPLMESARAQSKASVAARAEAKEHLRTLQGKREQLVNDYAARLRKELGDTRFSWLNTRIRKIMNLKGYQLQAVASR